MSSVETNFPGVNRQEASSKGAASRKPSLAKFMSFPLRSRGGVKRDRRGVGYVEALDPVADRQPGEGVAMRLDIVADALPFRAEHERDAPRAERGGELGFRLAGQPDPPEA